MRLGADRAIDFDALHVWALCKAGGWSIKAALRRRVAKALEIAAKMQGAENRRVEETRKELIHGATLRLAEWAKRPELLVLPEALRLERWEAEKVVSVARVRAELAELRPRMFEPHHAMPLKVLSNTSLDRHRYAALKFLSDKLSEVRIPVR
jgi:hypothetical protein